MDRSAQSFNIGVSGTSLIDNDVSSLDLEDGPAELLGLDASVGLDDTLSDSGHDSVFFLS